jgi:2,3-dihydroxy-p-cumate/2,3-dihydroxybenzoate 3,4-dioxygenase
MHFGVIQMTRYRKLGYVELNVESIARSEPFYRDVVGLQHVGRRQDGSVLLRCDTDVYSVVLHEKTPAGLKCAGLMLEDASQFEPLHGQLLAHGVAYEELSASERNQRQIARATRITEPHTQATLEFYVRADEASDRTFQQSHTRIQRLGHIVLGTPRSSEAVTFFRDVLNFRVSDRIGETMTFMRPYPNPFHHGIGVVRSGRPMLHHVNFMVTEIDDIGRALHRLHAQGAPIVHGPGKHPTSGSVFLYFLDPDGITLEYSFGMEEFGETSAREPRALPAAPESIDSWGAIRDPRMGSVGELEVATIAPINR